MSNETMVNLIARALNDPEEFDVTFAFQGGEPTMAGLPFFQDFIHEVNNRKGNRQVNYSIQTNGILLNDEWIDFLGQEKFLVGISLDGFQENHDKFRIDHKHQGTHQSVMNILLKLQEKQIDYNILTVLTESLAQEPEKLYLFYKEHQFNFVQLIPCLPDLKNTKQTESLTPSSFAWFYKIFYDLWAFDFSNGEYMSISLFDNVIPMYNAVAPNQCGMLGFCSPQFVIESDGSVYPCDFYVLDKYKLGNINTDNYRDLLKHRILNEFISEPKRMSELCKSCRYQNLCHGNCKRMNVVLFDESMCGYQEFLSYTEKSMIEIISSKHKQAI